MTVRARKLGRVALLAFAAGAVGAPAAGAACQDGAGPVSPAPGPGLARLQPNPDRSTLAVPLDDQRAGGDDIVFETNPRRPLGAGDRAVTATLLSFPRRESRRLDARVTVRARPAPTRDRVTLEVCVNDKGRFTAGAFQGTVLVHGPRMAEFTHPLAITSKWPFWVPALLLFAVFAAHLALAWRTGSPPGPTGASRRVDAVASTIYGVVAVGAIALTYWSVYVKNDTWGEDPAVQIPALVVAALTAVVAAQQGAREWMQRSGGE